MSSGYDVKMVRYGNKGSYSLDRVASKFGEALWHPDMLCQSVKKGVKLKVIVGVVVAIVAVCVLALVVTLVLVFALKDNEPTECSDSQIQCNTNSKYRTFDGSCNNLQYPHDGEAKRKYRRILPAEYADGIEAPRLGVSGNALPSARKVSVELYEAMTGTSGINTLMLMTFGQLLDHDTDLTPMSEITNQQGMSVTPDCGSNGCMTSAANMTECLPIDIPSNDPDFTKSCLKFVRSKKYCETGTREQSNSITSWIDASFVYGSSLEMSNKLRNLADASRGQLRMTIHPLDGSLKDLLPLQNDSKCKDLDNIVQCFLTGDSRQNVQVGLIALHTIFVRLHNYFEEQLHLVNPSWDGEKLFQESRRLLIAVWQNMVYYEYIPVVLGPQHLQTFQLGTKSNVTFSGYDGSTEGLGDVFNVFSTAAFRFGHSQITDTIRFSSQNYSVTSDVPFSSVFFRPRLIYESPISGTSGIDAVVLGMISQRAENTDRFFSKQVTAKLFSDNPPNGLGTDLGALNTQRGRDHGLPSYNKWRKWCGLSVATSFFGFIDMTITTREKLARLYEHPDDVDLFAGGMAETTVSGGVVGPTFACILGFQFRNLKVADRYWFENDISNIGFTAAQIQNIHGFTFSKALCLTLDNVDTIQKYNMLLPIDEAMQNLGTNQTSDIYSYASLYRGSSNAREPCGNLSNIDFNLWTGI